MNIVQQDAQDNKKYEDWVIDYHRKTEKYWDTFVDVRDNPEYRKIDVDVLFRGQKWEIKTGTTVADWGNIPVERINTYYTATDMSMQLGWLYLSQADYVAYYDYKQGREYIIYLPALRKYVYDKGTDIKSYDRIHTKRYDDNTIEHSNFYAMPVQELEEAGVILGYSDYAYEDANNIF